LVKIFSLFFLGVILSSCSAKKALEAGNYDLAIIRAVSKLKNQPNHYASIETLKAAYKQGTNAELQDAKKLEEINTAEGWEKALNVYQEIIRKQKLISNLQSLQEILAFEDFNGKAEIASNNAAKLYYIRGEETLEDAQTKADFQKAYEYFSKTNRYNSNYKEVKSLMDSTRNEGIYFVLISIDNPNNLALPEEFSAMLTDFKPEQLNKTWVLFYKDYEIGKTYDYNANFTLEAFAVGSNKSKTEKYTESKDIITSYKIEKDAKGNVKKDAKGQPIKTPVYTTKKAEIIKTIRSKEAFIKGSLSLIDNFNMNTFNTINVSGIYKFESETATYKGESVALSNQTKKLIKQKLQSFPSYKTMVMEAGENLRSNLFFQLKRNQRQFGE